VLEKAAGTVCAFGLGKILTFSVPKPDIGHFRYFYMKQIINIFNIPIFNFDTPRSVGLV
jgi:hypothetical protein